MYGWIGKILKVDLTLGKTFEIDTLNYADRFIGGRGIEAKIAWDEIPPLTGPYDPENRLMFFSGPLSGTLVPSSGRINVAAISPWSSPPSYSRSSAGGDFAASMKFAGYDGIVIFGRSEEPVYIWIHDSKSEIILSEDLWGLDTKTTRKILSERHGKNTETMVIGPAGENMVRWSTIQTGIDSSVAHGGFGAVMGSKRLKALVVTESSLGVKVARPEELIELVNYTTKLLSRQDNPHPWKGYHTLTIPSFWSVTKRLRNRIVRPYACFACPIACKPLLDVPGVGVHSGMCTDFIHYGMLEANKKGEAYTAAIDGSCIPDLYGLNNKGIKELVQWFTNCYNAGLISNDDAKTFLYNLKDFGTGEWLKNFCEIVSNKKGFIGELMAEGVHYGSLRLGKMAKKFDTWDIHGYPPHIHRGGNYRNYKGAFAIAALDSRGDPTTDHGHMWIIEVLNKELRSPDPSAYITPKDVIKLSREVYGDEKALDQTTWEGKANVVIYDSRCAAFKNSLVVCDMLFPVLTSMYTDDHRGDTSIESKLFTAVTGIQKNESELKTVGERIINVERAVLVRNGRTRKDDILGDSFFNQPGDDFITIGPKGKAVMIKGSTVDRERFERCKTEIYRKRGWNTRTGIPTRMTLEKLNLKDIADGLKDYFS